ncbi:serine/threonine transporter SstT [Candidatus Erwinia haradaeae]|uniref:Serine/threonine transporter SstT n=1 Tax=Candidatus Erwinia haradaeae TaxID=1922217 RepID=A0A451DAD9_9GAMM|nr:serine/threonine transporter SstT [Candidatus Erwinia haradaeae]VFP83300.1 Serine/threonine transporter SstT [Candidatus Erwinia haradaeae]
MKKEHSRYIPHSLVTQIILSLVLGISLSYVSHSYAIAVGILGDLFVNALKAIAPLLVLMLILTSISSYDNGQKNNIRRIIVLYLLSTFSASILALIASYLNPQHLTLQTSLHKITISPSNIIEVLHSFLMSMVTNPIEALMHANYISILIWGIGLGFAFRTSSESTHVVLNDISNAITKLVHIVMKCAPIGIFGLVSSTIASAGFDVLWQYAQLLSLLLCCMLLILLLFNPLLVWWYIRRNPYPLVFTCLRESGITAFFTRSSAANIPVNMALAKKLGLNPRTYTISIPIGANISMAGASITITALTLATMHTLSMTVDVSTAILLSIIASICACGASGIAGGSLLLMPVVCHIFGIPEEVAMQVVGIGFIISILQDAAETALNSSTDILFTAAVCMSTKYSPKEKKEHNNKDIPSFMEQIIDKQNVDQEIY